MTAEEAENMTGDQARYLEAQSLIDMAYRLGLPIPDLVYYAEGAPDAEARAAIDAGRERCDGSVIYAPIEDPRRYGLEIRNGSSVYRWVHVNDAIVHAAAQQSDVTEPAVFAHKIIASDPERFGRLRPWAAAPPVAASLPDLQVGETAARLEATVAAYEAGVMGVTYPAGKPAAVALPFGPTSLPGPAAVMDGPADLLRPVSAQADVTPSGPGQPDQTAVMPAVEAHTEAIPAVTEGEQP